MLAIRRRNESLLFEGDDSPFHLIPNSFLYWKADPFLFEYQGSHYLFAEMFNRLLGRGCIGVARITDGKCGVFRPCLKLGCHLSYPCVFEQDGAVYMLPEMASSGKMKLYKAISFPLIWKEAGVFCEASGVDATPLPKRLSKGLQAVSTLHQGGAKRNDNLYLIEMHGKPPVPLLANDLCSRPAGHFIEKDGKVIRPVQDCSEYYGKRLLFNLVTDASPANWHEQCVGRVTVPSDANDDAITVRLTEGDTRHFKGIHTYNLDSKYEVIDLQFNAGNTWQYLARKLIKRIGRMLRRQ